VTIQKSQFPRGLRCGFPAALLLGLRVRIPSGGMDVLSLVSDMCYQVVMCLRRVDHSSREVLPTGVPGCDLGN